MDFKFNRTEISDDTGRLMVVFVNSVKEAEKVDANDVYFGRIDFDKIPDIERTRAVSYLIAEKDIGVEDLPPRLDC